MSKLQDLNRKMLELEHNGDITEQEYATYKLILATVESAKELLTMYARMEELQQKLKGAA